MLQSGKSVQPQSAPQAERSVAEIWLRAMAVDGESVVPSRHPRIFARASSNVLATYSARCAEVGAHRQKTAEKLVATPVSEIEIGANAPLTQEELSIIAAMAPHSD